MDHLKCSVESAVSDKIEPGIYISTGMRFFSAMIRGDDISTQSDYLHKTNSGALEFTLCIHFLMK